MSKEEFVLELARKLIGIREASGNNDGPEVAFLQTLVAGPDQPDEWKCAPWCVIATVSLIHMGFHRCGVESALPWIASSQELHEWLKARGFLLDQPTPNCIGFLLEGGVPKHTFLVSEPQTDQGFVFGIDGNWSDSECRTQHKIADCAFGRMV